jgi:hypothetical protein
LIYTSYFASKKYKPEDGVSIARYCKFWNGLDYEALKPPEDLINWWKSLSPKEQQSFDKREQYKCAYINRVLAQLDVHEIAKELDNKVLLCYEKSADFCHRHIVAQWLQNSGYGCGEL